MHIGRLGEYRGRDCEVVDLRPLATVALGLKCPNLCLLTVNFLSPSLGEVISMTILDESFYREFIEEISEEDLEYLLNVDPRKETKQIKR